MNDVQPSGASSVKSPSVIGAMMTAAFVAAAFHCGSSGDTGDNRHAPSEAGNGTVNGTGGATPSGSGGASGGVGGSVAAGGNAGSGGALGHDAAAGSNGGGNGAGGGSGTTGAGGSGLGSGGTTGGGGTTGAGGDAGPREASSNGGSVDTDGSTRTSAFTITASWPGSAIFTGVRGVTTPAVTQTLRVHNGGTAPLMVSALAIDGANRAAFQIVGPPQLPAVLAAGADLPVTVDVMTTGNALPAAPAQNDGGTVLTGMLTASAGSLSAEANLFGVLLTTATHEVTLGQILTTLGYKLNVGLAQNNANPNTGAVQQLPNVEPGTDEIAAPLFKKGPAGSATLLPVARFSPKGPMPFGWYPAGNSAMRNQIGAMTSVLDAQTSDKARMILPPLTGSTSFDPGAGAFGIWVYTDQLSQLYDVGGVATNGDYAYSEDAPNSPANVHRTKVYPLKDATGAAVPGSYLLAVEEAGNGDYQDYVFVLSNVTVAQ
jgi:hypothetical protein